MAQNVLISSPSSRVEVVGLPYIYGLLKTYCDRDEHLSERVNWLPPVYRLDRPENLLREYDLESVDVLGLSCYTWNWLAQREIGRRVKQHNPDCLVVAGGPHCDYDDPDFFERNPYLDIIVEKEGERPFREILRQRVEGRSDWTDIPGLYLRDDEGVPTRTAPPELLPPEDFLEVSPYRAQEDVYQRIIRQARESGRLVGGAIESNRGCPYRCTFCDWGSLTYTQVRKLSMDRVKRDIRWLSRNEVPLVGIVDANVGMFERDVEIVEYVTECKERYGYPRNFGYNPTKTRATHLPRIIRLLQEHDLIARSMFSVQHTHPEVLDAIERKNLTREELDELIAFNKRHDYPVLVQLILGCPNDTYDRWKRCLTDLMEWGIDGRYVIANFQILPNAPAADPDYMEEWEIEVTTTKNISRAVIDDEVPVPKLAKKQAITSTATYDEDDWIRMWIYSYFVLSFHSMGLTHRLALYLRYCEGISFHRFYEGLVDDLVRGSDGALRDCVERMTREKREFLEDDEKAVDYTSFEFLPEDAYQPQWEEWLFVHAVLNRREIYRDLEDWLIDRFVVDEARVRDLVRYQREIVVTPEYDRSLGKTFEGEYDWVEYFSRDRDQLDRPPIEDGRRFVIDQSTLGEREEVPIDWDDRQGRDRTVAWIDSVVKNFPYQYPPRFRGRTVTLHDVTATSRRSPIRRLREGISRSLRRAFTTA